MKFENLFKLMNNSGSQCLSSPLISIRLIVRHARTI